MAEQDTSLFDKELTPGQYFDEIKSRKNTVTDSDLLKIYDNCLELIEKYKITGQWKAIKRLIFHLETIEKEREIVKLGINTFVYRDDIEYYINNVASDIVKIIDIESYEREIPDEIVDIIAKFKDKFDQLYIIFTDYTQELTRKVNKERDPILFGCFKDPQNKVIIDRFYYLGDWVDEFCDLTLDKMVNETAKVGHRNISHTISTPDSIEELKEQANQYGTNSVLTTSGVPMIVSNKKKSFFESVKTFFNRK